MTSTVSEEFKAILEGQLATGLYADAETLLREALAVLAEHQATVDDLQASLEDIQAGRVRPLAEVANEIRQRHGWSASP